MPFATHYRVSAIGRIGVNNPTERFQYGFCCAGDALDQRWNLTDDGFSNDLADDVYNFHARAASRISSEALLETVKIAKIGPNGKYLEDPKILSRVTGGGSNHNSFVLPQSALVVSLVTARRGPSGKGRFYLPMPIVTCNPAQHFSILDSEAATVNASAEELIEAVNNLPGIDAGFTWGVCVASTKGYNTPVTGVRTGVVVDTMRSRRTSIPENYSPVLDVD